MVTNHKIKEFVLGIIIVAMGFLSYKITSFFNDDSFFSYGMTGFNSAFLIHFAITFVVLGSIAAVGFLLLIKRFSSRQASNTSRLLNWRQVKSEMRAVGSEALVPKKDKKFNQSAHLLLSQNLKLNNELVFHHTVVVAGSGGGKTSSILLPQLFTLNGPSIIITDPKGEIYHKTHKAMEAKGYLPVLLKLDDPSRSVKYNLLGNCKTINDVRKLAESILGKDEWGMLSQTLLQAFLFRQWALGGTITDVVKDLAECPVDTYELELEYFKGEEVDENARMAFDQFVKTSQGGSLVSSIFATIQSKMKVFEDPNIEEISKGGKFRIEYLRRKKIILYISYPEEESTYYSPFLASFYYQTFNILKGDESVNQSKDSGELGLPVYFLLDEAANLGAIPEFDKLMATIRSKKMGVEIFLQAFEQLNSVYGVDSAKSIIQNCKTKITLSGVSDEAARKFSELAGKREVESTSITYSGKNSVSTSTSIKEKDVISADEIRRMKSHQMLIISDNLRPIIDDKNYYYMDKIDFWFFKNTRFSNETKRKLAMKFKKLIGYKK